MRTAEPEGWLTMPFSAWLDVERVVWWDGRRGLLWVCLI